MTGKKKARKKKAKVVLPIEEPVEAREAPTGPPATESPEAGPVDADAPAPESGNGEEPEVQDPALPEDALVLLAVRGMTLFPGVVLPIAVGRERSVRAIQAAARGGHPFGVLLQKNADIEAQVKDLESRIAGKGLAEGPSL